MKDKKNLFEILIIPIVIAIVGVLGTYFVTEQQIKSAELLSKAQLESSEFLAKSEQQIKIIEIFSNKITSDDARERELAVRILGALDKDLAKKLASVIVNNKKESQELRSIAKQVIQEENNFYAVLRKFDKLISAQEFIKKRSKKETMKLDIYEIEDVFMVTIGHSVSEREAKERLMKIKSQKEGFIFQSDEMKRVKY